MKKFKNLIKKNKNIKIYFFKFDAKYGILLSWLISWLGTLVYTKEIFMGRLSPLIFQDIEYLYLAAVVQARNFSYGEIGFWNPYDNLDLSYLYLSGGLNYSEVIPGFFAFVVKALIKDIELSFVIFPFYFALITAVRVVGVYLLLMQFVRNKNIIFTMSLFSSFVLATPLMMGLNTSAQVAFTPIILAYIFKIISNPDMRTIYIFTILIVSIVSTNPLIAAGYFYQAIHPIILSAIALILISSKYKKKWISFLFKLKEHTSRSNKFKGLLKFFLPLLIALPTLFLIFHMFEEIETGSARIEKPFSPKAYLNSSHFGIAGGQPTLLATNAVLHLLSPQINTWWNSWPFISFIYLALAILGFFTSKDSRKYILLSGFIFLVSLQLPRTDSGLISLGHHLNAITNPFAFLNRSMHMPLAFWGPILLLPLAAIGLEAIVKSSALPRKQTITSLILIATVGTLFMIISGQFIDPNRTLNYLVLILVIIIFLVICIPEISKFKRLVVSLLFMTFLLTFFQSYVYVRQEVNEMISFQSTNLSAMTRELDFLIPPNRIDLTSGFLNEGYLATDPIGMRGIILGKIEVGKYFGGQQEYKPRSKYWQNVSRNSLFVKEENTMSAPYFEVIKKDNIKADVEYSVHSWPRIDEEKIEIRVNHSDLTLIIRRPVSDNIEIKINSNNMEFSHLSKAVIKLNLQKGNNEIILKYNVPVILKYGLPLAILLSYILIFYSHLFLFKIINRENFFN